MNAIEKKIVNIIVDSFPEMYSDVSESEQADFFSMLDSIQMLEIMATIENEFGIFFDETDLNIEHFKSLQSLSEFVSDKYAQSKQHTPL